jgi:hypothetical protein
VSDVALWLTVLALGAWHGLNPAMGWPLAVANGLTEKRGSAVLATIVPLGTGHLLAMAVVLLPFAALGWLMAWSGPVRLAAGAAVLLFGLYRLMQPRHPRMLARIPPTRLALWSFLMSSAHGAGLMLLPFALGLCASGPGQQARLGNELGMALVVSGLHTAAMVAAGVGVAWVVYRSVGLQVLRRGWLNLEVVWSASLIVAGAASVALAWPAPVS